MLSRFGGLGLGVGFSRTVRTRCRVCGKTGGFGVSAGLLLEAFIEFFLRPVVEPMRPGKVAFLDQLRLGRQPMLHIVTWPRTFVHVAKISPSGHFVNRRRKISFFLLQVNCLSRPRGGESVLVLVLGQIVVLHKGSMGLGRIKLRRRPKPNILRIPPRGLPWSNLQKPWNRRN